MTTKRKRGGYVQGYIPGEHNDRLNEQLEKLDISANEFVKNSVIREIERLEKTEKKASKEPKKKK